MGDDAMIDAMSEGFKLCKSHAWLSEFEGYGSKSKGEWASHVTEVAKECDLTDKVMFTEATCKDCQGKGGCLKSVQCYAEGFLTDDGKLTKDICINTNLTWCEATTGGTESTDKS